MGTINSYEFISVLILLIIFILYTRHDWLDLRRNRVFLVMLSTASFSALVVLICCWFLQLHITTKFTTINSVCSITGLGLHLLCAELYVYYMALMQYKKKFYTVMGFVLWCLTIGFVVAFIGNSATGILFHMVGIIDYQKGPLLIPLVLLSELYLILGSKIVMECKRDIAKYQYYLMLVSNAIVMVLVYIRYLHPLLFEITFYVIAGVLALYYLLFHMADQQLRQEGGCFSRVGLRHIVEEREVYKIDFLCLSVSIVNMASILSVCTEDELRKIHKILVKHFKAVAKEREIFQQHSSEYIILAKDEITLAEYWEAFRRTLPLTIRLGDKSINVIYSYYKVSFSDANCKEGDFYRLLAAMRKNAQTHLDTTELLSFDGEIKEKYQRRLLGISLLDEILENQRISLEIFPILSTNDCSIDAMEIHPVMYMPDGQRVSEHEIWNLSEKNGTTNKTYLCLWNSVASYVAENHILERGVNRIQMDVMPSFICSPGLVDQCVEVLSHYQIPTHAIVLEVFVDLSVSDQLIQEGIRYVKEKGLQIMLDQFGINVCNLKNVLTFDFDMVKINARMMGRFLRGKEDELLHVVSLLSNQGWEIYANGVDRPDRSGQLARIGITHIQGKSFQRIQKEQDFLRFLPEKGGA